MTDYEQALAAQRERHDIERAESTIKDAEIARVTQERDEARAKTQEWYDHAAALNEENTALRNAIQVLREASGPFLVGNRCERVGDVDCDEFPEQEPCRVCSLRYALAAFGKENEHDTN